MKGKQMTYLCIYKKKSNNGHKLYFATTKKLTDKIAITNQEFKTVILSYKNKIQSYRFNELSDLKRIYPELKEKYAGKIYVIENRYKNLTQIKLVVFLLGNPLWEVGLSEIEETNEVEEEKCNTRTIEIESIEDWKLAEKEFDFQSDFIYDVLKGE